MKRKIHIFLIKLYYLISSPFHVFKQKIISVNGIELWIETFGKQGNPPLLFIMGCGAPGLLWHQKFCEQLADKGFFVIRYDHRNVGLSSMVDYQKFPYDLMDMAKDAIGILDHYNLQQAHIVGGSMGGIIAMLLAAHFPESVLTLTLIMTTSDGRATLDALEEKHSESALSPPDPTILEWFKDYKLNTPKTLVEKEKKFLEVGRIQNGPVVPFDEKLYRKLGFQSLIKTRNLDGVLIHLKAWDASCGLHKQAASKIKAPTLIIHGDQDPIFPLDHALALKQAISHAQLTIIKGMGHGLNTQFYNVFIEKIEGITRTVKSK